MRGTKPLLLSVSLTHFRFFVRVKLPTITAALTRLRSIVSYHLSLSLSSHQMASSAKTLESILFDPVARTLSLLDQRVLPHVVKVDPITTVQQTHDAIKEMRVRGAPAIAVTAVLGVAVAANLQRATFATADAAVTFLRDSLAFVQTSRPTAVNLFNAVADFTRTVDTVIAPAAKTVDAVIDAFMRVAHDYYLEDVRLNEGIMRAGAAHILARLPPSEATRKVRVLTICNTGALATSRFGTALGVVRQLHYDHRLEQLYSLETRPWNQGARLTVYECVEEGIPVTLLVDSAASALMAKVKIDAVVVGADRICRNGDTANKIGTYHLAVAAKHHGVPFYVAAPSTTLDPATATGGDVHIEERSTEEITHASGGGRRIVAEGPTLSVWNPVFDITPEALITGGIITEAGVIAPSASGTYDITAQPAVKEGK